jgi:HD superfamily phosphohydrolase
MRLLRIDFYDPLYDRVSLRETDRNGPREVFGPGFSKTLSAHQKNALETLNEDKVLLPFLSSIEFARQSFLKQSNLAFLVYPSATHTRLAHALGSCYLGELASQEVHIGEKLKHGRTCEPVLLSRFLEENGWREEFYLALLLHDIGHFPFSHALESNKDFWKAFKKEIHHEETACELILGNGKFSEASRRRIAGKGAEAAANSLHLADLFTRYANVDRKAICYLISGNEKYLSGKLKGQRAQLQVLHELVSGLLDLDRVDHYRRDNYFTGVRAGTNLNFPSLLSGITIYYQRDLKQPPELWLSSFAIGHAISLLLSKERLTEDCFEHPHSIAYEVMLHHAFNMYFLGEEFYELGKVGSIPPDRNNEVYDLLTSTDEQLLLRMGQGGGKRVCEAVFRIFNKRPYSPVARLHIRARHDWELRSLRKEISALSNVPKTDVVIRVSSNFGKGKPGVRTGEWLNLDQLRNADGKHLSESKYKLHIEHFKKAQDEIAADEQIWIYSTNEDKAKQIVSALQSICRKLGHGCREGDL